MQRVFRFAVLVRFLALLFLAFRLGEACVHCGVAEFQMLLLFRCATVVWVPECSLECYP